jgi:predicted ester cyclase
MSGDFVALSKKVYEALNSGNLGLLDDAYAADAKIHGAGREFDPASYKAFLQEIMKGIPDGKTAEIETFASGDSGCTRFVLSGTLTGRQSTWPVESKGQAVRIDYAAVGHTQDGKIKELWLYSDRLALMQQLGAMPTAVGG